MEYALTTPWGIATDHEDICPYELELQDLRFTSTQVVNDKPSAPFAQSMKPLAGS